MPDISTQALLVDKPTGTLSQDTTGFNILFVHSSIDDMGLSAAAFRVYAHLARRANKTDRHCWPGIRAIAETCLLSKTTVMAAIIEIEQRGMVVVTKAQSKTEKQGRNDYFLTDAKEWIRLHETGCTNLGTTCTNLKNKPRRSRTGASSKVRVPKQGTPKPSKKVVPIKVRGCINLGNRGVPECGTELDPLNCIQELDPCSNEDLELLGEEFMKSAPKTKKRSLSKEELIRHLQVMFPDVDVSTEYRKASAWLLVRPNKKFTQRFFAGWVSRSDGSTGLLPVEKPKKTCLIQS